MKRQSITIVLSAVVLAISISFACGATAQKGADQLMTEAYSAFVGADSAAASGTQREAALAAYRHALEIYVQISETHPDYQKNVVGYRITQCLNEIQRLKAAGVTEPPSHTLTATNPPPATTNVASAEPTDITPDEMLDPEAMNEELTRLTRERDTLSAQNELFSRQIDRLTARSHYSWKFWEKSAAVTNEAAAFDECAAAIRSEAQRMMNAGSAPAAVRLLSQAVELFPERTEMRIMLGSACCQSGRYEDAMHILNPVLGDNPKNERAHLIMGTAFMGLGKLKQARKETEAAIALNQNTADAHYNLAQILLNITPAEPYLARDHYRRAIELGGQADPKLEDQIRRTCLLRKATDLRKK
jgi:tetratricopeptide (TPR) repeat protein